MEEILHQLISSISHYLQGSIHPRWCRISSINSIFIDPYINTHILHGVVTHNFPRVKDPSCSSLKIWGMDRVRSGNPGTLGREGGRDAGKAMLFFFFSFLSKEVGLFFCWASFLGADWYCVNQLNHPNLFDCGVHNTMNLNSMNAFLPLDPNHQNGREFCTGVQKIVGSSRYSWKWKEIDIALKRNRFFFPATKCVFSYF